MNTGTNISHHTKDIAYLSSLIKEKLAHVAQLDESRIQLTNPLSEYLIDSIKIIRFAALVCDELNLEMEPILTVDFDSLNDLVQKLHIMMNDRDAPK